METTLNCLKDGEEGRITSLDADGSLRRRLLDFGLIVGTPVRCLRRSPWGSPVIYRVRGTMLAIRACDGQRIRVEQCG